MDAVVIEAIAVLSLVLVGCSGLYAVFTRIHAPVPSLPSAVMCSFTVSSTSNSTYVLIYGNITLPYWILVFSGNASDLYGPFNESLAVITGVLADRVVVVDGGGDDGVCVFHA